MRLDFWVECDVIICEVLVVKLVKTIHVHEQSCETVKPRAHPAGQIDWRVVQPAIHSRNDVTVALTGAERLVDDPTGHGGQFGTDAAAAGVARRLAV